MTNFFKKYTTGPYQLIALGVALVILFLLPLVLGSENYFVYLLFVVFLFAVFGHAWNLLAGFGGLLSFGNQVYIGIGGFSMAMWVYYGQLNIWSAWLLGGLSSLAVAYLMAIPVKEEVRGKVLWYRIGIALFCWLLYEIAIVLNPALDVFGSPYIRRVFILLLIFLGTLPLLKLQGAYFAIATWLIAESFGSIFKEWRIAGAGGGMQVKSELNLITLYYTALILLIVTTYIIWRLLRSRYGLAITAVRDNEKAAQTVGIDIRWIKLILFLLAGGFTGLASGLYYIDSALITPPAAFSIFWSAAFVFVVVSGGMGTLSGPIIGAIIYVFVDRILGSFFDQGLLILGISAILFILFLPRGIVGVFHDIKYTGIDGPLHTNPLKRLWLGISGRKIEAPLTSQLRREVKQGNSELIPAKNVNFTISRPNGPGVVSAFLVSGNPLPILSPHNSPWYPVIEGFHQARQSLEESRPDTLLIYSTQWFAVLDQLWQVRPSIEGSHIDENWHDLGEIPFHITIDTELADVCVNSKQINVRSKAVDYDGFPIDVGTIVAQHFLNPMNQYPCVIAANNLYHDATTTRKLAKFAVEQARSQGKRIALIGIGGLSGTLFREEIDFQKDRIASTSDDNWNRRILSMIETGNRIELEETLEHYVKAARVDMGFKHFHWILGGLNGQFHSAKVYGYGPAYGTGQVVLEFFI